MLVQTTTFTFRTWRGRYVRILMTRPAQSGESYILSELEVFGCGGPVAVAHAANPPQHHGSIPLSGGKWRLQRASLVSAGGDQISTQGYADNDWMIATVPGTVLTSYLKETCRPDRGLSDGVTAFQPARSSALRSHAAALAPAS